MRPFIGKTKASGWRPARFLSALAIGLLGATSSASAASCMWTVPAKWRLEQSNGWTIFMTLQQSDTSFHGTLGSTTDHGLRDAYRGAGPTGQVKGSFNGDLISFVIAWSDGQKGDYRGTIGSTGYVVGTTFSVRNPSSKATWYSASPLVLVCIEEPAAPPDSSAPPPAKKRLGTAKDAIAPQAPDSTPPIGPAKPTATANNDVDIYNGPGGEFDVIGMLEGGTKAPILGYQNGWYRLQVNVPGGSGWVAEDHLTVNP